MTRITEDQYDLLSQVVDGYAEGKEEFYFSTGAGIGTTMQHAGIEGRESVNHGDIEELWDLGLIDVTPGNSPMSGRLRPTAEGIYRVNEQRRIDAITRTDEAISSGSGESSVTWRAILPVLEAVVDLYGQVPASQDVSQAQVNQRLEREEDSPETSRAFEVLERGGYLEGRVEVDQTPGPLTVAPTEKALQLLAEWPADGAVALERFVATLQARIDASDDEEERGKLQRVLDAVQGVGENIVAEVLTKVMMGG